MTKDCKDIEPRHNTKAHQQLFPQHTHKEKKKIILISGSKIWPNTVLYSESDVTYLVGKRDFTTIGRKGFFAQIYTQNSGFIIIIIIILTRMLAIREVIQLSSKCKSTGRDFGAWCLLYSVPWIVI